MAPRAVRISRRSRLAANRTPPAIFNLPHDLMALVCDLLLPADMLSLYRSCKTIRAFLRQGSSKILWKAARANVDGLPACPDWLTEPQYATLCFDQFCFRCLAVDECSKNPLWSFLVRYCVACREERLTLKNPLDDLPLGTVLADLRARPSDFFPMFTTYVLENDEYTWVEYFHVPEIETLQAELATKISSSEDSFSAIDGTAQVVAAELSVSALLKAKQADTKARREFAAECKKWMVQWKLQQRLAALAIKSKRRSDILKHLQDLGYADEVRDLGPSCEGFSEELSGLVNQARPLTQREWNTIRPGLIVFMDWRRELESRAKYVRLMASRLRLLQTTLFKYLHEEVRRDKRFDGVRAFPTLLDLLDVRDAARLISLPDGAILLPQVWITCLPKFVKAWEEARVRPLVSLLYGLDPSSSADVPSPSTSADIHPIAARVRSTVPCLPLLHPAALFWCDLCTSIVPGIVAMTHTCCYGRGGEDSRDILSHLNATLDGTYSQPLISGDSDDYLYKKTVIAFSEGVLPWSYDKLHGCLPIVRSILKACDVEADDLLKELHSVETVRFACRTCSQGNKCVLAMGWLRAISHAFEVHGGQEGSWAMLPPRLVEKVKNAEYAARESIAKETCTRARWECSRCTWDQPESVLAYTWPQLSGHFAEFHPFTDLSPTWYRASQDSPPFMRPAVLLVQRGVQVVTDEGNEDASFPRKHLVVHMKLTADTWCRLLG